MPRSASRSERPWPPGRAAALLLLLGWAAATVAVAADAGPDESLAVVVHPSVELDDISFAELRKIMLGDRQFWPSGERVTLIIRRPVARERTVILEQIYRMSEAQFRQYWIAKVFRAEARSGPRVVLSNDEASDLVGVLSGAITVIKLSDVPEGMKILRIDGREPGEPGYLVK